MTEEKRHLAPYVAQTIPEGFTPWSGGKMPTPELRTLVTCIFRNGKRYTHSAGLFDWSGTPGAVDEGSEIIAYRVDSPVSEIVATNMPVAGLPNWTGNEIAAWLMDRSNSLDPVQALVMVRIAEHFVEPPRKVS
jgi:hypothetical protein